MRDKCIAIGVTGGIAAYKVAGVASALRQAGADVHVIMTAAATHFISPLTFATLSGNEVVADMFERPAHWEIKHVALADRADAFLVAPASANTIAKLAAGLADNMVTAVALATRAPVIIAPAMNEHMLAHRATQDNLARLRAFGYHVMECGEGHLACGATGQGRLPEPAAMVAEVERILGGARDPAGRSELALSATKGPALEGLTVLITSGPTREPIDAVRFISNRSTGKMGYALAQAAAGRGARVILVSGPTALPDPPGTQVVRVETTAEMLAAVEQHVEHADVVIGAAAPSDYAPQEPAAHKITKSAPHIALKLERTPDLLAWVAERKGERVLVGFAAETSDLIARAQDKLARKRLDLMVANDVTVEGAGFAADTNVAALVFPDGRVEELPLMSKLELAQRVMEVIARLARERRGA
ncbi:MAG TPA: bifunctional phosphopantothenoylcysteine decarboxylase/phosphopantothenate--cysteine ligase CoaBC [Armatimonadota bacterium]|nr:bifunctional phosphopantothenoylcysteine decarboxylase/phosphopantothenate--cysteine ligase CoaBC [Armatimonadota bacterium]